MSNRCYGCEPPQRESDPDRRRARTSGVKYYVPADPCVRCGMRAARSVQSGRCFACFPPINRPRDPARQCARALGLKEYASTFACADCGQQSIRSVQYDRCYNCRPLTSRPINRPRDPSRQEGRRAGQIIYLPTTECADCRQLAPRSVQYDKCYSPTCMPDRYGMIGAIAGAAAIGRTTVTLLCRKHGPVQHNVLTGRCLSCGAVGHAPR